MVIGSTGRYHGQGIPSIFVNAFSQSGLANEVKKPEAVLYTLPLSQAWHRVMCSFTADIRAQLQHGGS